MARIAVLAAAIGGALPSRAAEHGGEIVCLDRRGRPDFGALMSRRAEPLYVAFDLLVLDGNDLRGRPLLERKRHLRSLVARDTR